jgi:hypothetical protein
MGTARAGKPPCLRLYSPDRPATLIGGGHPGGYRSPPLGSGSPNNEPIFPCGFTIPMSKISTEDRLRLYAIVQTEFGSYELGKVVCALADSVGLEDALRMLNRSFADPRMQDDRPTS